MKKPLFIKFIMMAGITLLLIIPISMIDELIGERSRYRATVIDDIAQSASRSQTITGPILVVPYSKTVRVWRKPSPEELPQFVEEQREGQLYFLPTTYRVDADLATEIRKRGIYEALLYHSTTKLSGKFELPERFGIKEEYDTYAFKVPFVAFGISDIRGIENAVKLSINEGAYAFEPGTQLKRSPEGIHAPITNIDLTQTHELDFKIDLNLQGTQSLVFTPIGKETYVRLQSNWPHPSFRGEYIPAEHTISSEGFSARWSTTYFSTNFESIFKNCFNNNNCSEFNTRTFGVDLIDPTDQYVKSDRAIKYALLFIVLTFAGFFLFELLKALKVHPVQYGLVGLSLAFFYLLLVSLSEHMTFGLAYTISALACITLIGFYIAHTLQSATRAASFSASLGLLYAMLYGLLSSEDYALLMGSTLLFVLLGAFMMLTRKLDWYSVGGQK